VGVEIVGVKRAANATVASQTFNSTELYGIICDEVRYARADRFPYGVFFQFDEPGVVVLSIRHGSREPKWRQADSSQ